MDFVGDRFVGQVKNVRRMSLAAIEALAEEAADAGFQARKLGVVVLKRSAGPGVKTPLLFVMTEDVWRALVGTEARSRDRGAGR